MSTQASALNTIRERLRGAVRAMLAGSQYAAARMPWGTPGPILLPDDVAQRHALIEAHLAGGPAVILYSPAGRPPQRMRLGKLELLAYSPDAAGRVRWLAYDLDGPDHGAGGLSDPAAAADCLAEACTSAGLADGLLVALSRGGVGRHVFIVLPRAVALGDAVVATGALAASAFYTASRSARERGEPHAFRRPDGQLGSLGQAGCVEMIPRHTERPARGWAIALPTPERLIAPLATTGQMPDATAAPDAAVLAPSIACDEDHWSQFVADARAKLNAHRRRRRPPRPAPRARPRPPGALSRSTREVLDGRVPNGQRNDRSFRAACELFRGGYSESEIARMLVAAGEACGLPAHEVRCIVASARRATWGEVRR